MGLSLAFALAIIALIMIVFLVAGYILAASDNMYKTLSETITADRLREISTARGDAAAAMMATSRR